MRVSILIDTYNTRRFIGAAVASALDQTVRPDEVIVSDDGSTDGTVAFLRERYADRITLVTPSVAPSGTGLERQAASIARAFARSTGDLILLLDGDDLFDRDRVERYVAAMRMHPSAVMVQAPLRHIDAEGRPLPWFKKQTASGEELLRLVQRTHQLDVFYSTSSLGFRRAFLERMLPLDLSDGLRVFTDDRLSIAALVVRGVITLPEPAGCWRRHDGSVTASLFRQRAFLARLARDRLRVFNLTRRGTPLRPLSAWRSPRYYLRWLRALVRRGTERRVA
jgi:glycosyltransferase involved in cell wall biosynthesis